MQKKGKSSYRQNTGKFINLMLQSTNCHEHQTYTKHVEEKYLFFAEKLREAIKEQFPQINVFLKPISTDLDVKVKSLKLAGKPGQEKRAGETPPTIIDQQRKP